MQDSIRGGVAQPSYLLVNHYYEFTEFISIVTEQHRVADCPPVAHVPSGYSVERVFVFLRSLNGP